MKKDYPPPYFSIITCTRNSEAFIEKNIESVEHQTYRNFEQIFIDGESTDDTRVIIRKHIKSGGLKAKLSVFPPKGISDAFNKGIKASRGRYILFLNSDDTLYDGEVLGDAFKYLQKNQYLDWIYGTINVVEKSGKTIGHFPRYGIFEHSSSALLRLFNYIPHQAVFMKRAVFEKYGLFDEGLSSVMDYEYWLRVSTKTRWGFVNRIISNFTIRKGAQTSSRSNRVLNRKNKDIVRKRYLHGLELMLVRWVNIFLPLVNRTLR